MSYQWSIRKEKYDKLTDNYGILELMLALISFQPQSSTYGLGYNDEIVNAYSISSFYYKLIKTDLSFAIIGKN